MGVGVGIGVGVGVGFEQGSLQSKITRCADNLDGEKTTNIRRMVSDNNGIESLILRKPFNMVVSSLDGPLPPDATNRERYTPSYSLTRVEEFSSQ